MVKAKLFFILFHNQIVIMIMQKIEWQLQRLIMLCLLYKCTLKDWSSNPCFQKYFIQKYWLMIIEKQILGNLFKCFFIKQIKEKGSKVPQGSRQLLHVREHFFIQHVFWQKHCLCQNCVKLFYIHSFFDGALCQFLLNPQWCTMIKYSFNI